MTENYEEARAEVERIVNQDEARVVSVRTDTLRALLSGPPEPSEEEVVAAIISCHTVIDYGEVSIAQAVQALYRSRRAVEKSYAQQTRSST